DRLPWYECDCYYRTAEEAEAKTEARAGCLLQEELVAIKGRNDKTTAYLVSVTGDRMQDAKLDEGWVNAEDIELPQDKRPEGLKVVL
nr:hypothetical protein [Chloroflexota bacterium]